MKIDYLESDVNSKLIGNKIIITLEPYSSNPTTAFKAAQALHQMINMLIEGMKKYEGKKFR